MSTMTPQPQTGLPSSAKLSAQLRLVNELGLRLQSLVGSENIYEEIVGIVQNKFHYYSFSIWSTAGRAPVSPVMRASKACM